MYFYVDESGQTGLELFDENQPFLYYGVLSSKVNLDLLTLPKIKSLRQKLGVDRLHAAELGNGRLVTNFVQYGQCQNIADTMNTF